VTAPVRALSGAGLQLAAQFQPLIATVQGAAGKIARNDCSPLREAVAEVEHAATQLITPVIEKVQPIVAAVKKVAGDLWDKIGAPVVDFIKQYAAEKWQEIQTVWDAIKSIASAIWDKTAWARDLIDKAWTWLKNLLAPFSRQLTVIGGVLIALSPAGPVLVIGAAVAGAVKGLQWVGARWGQGNAIVEARAYLEKTLIPPLVGAARNLSATITRMAGTITGALHSLAAGVAGAAHALGGDVLAVIAEPIQWVADQIAALADWATGELAHVAQGLTAALNGCSRSWRICCSSSPGWAGRRSISTACRCCSARRSGTGSQPASAIRSLTSLATAATVVASQAVISGAFSLTWQAMQLDLMPRLDVLQTSAHMSGQIYIPQINWLLLAAVLALVLGFQSSSALAAAYGFAVTGTMVITTVLATAVAHRIWGWSVVGRGRLPSSR